MISMLMKIFHDLRNYYSSNWEKKNNRKLQNWWPVSGRFDPKELEIVVGAILTQNTNWRNVEKAIENMKSGGLVNAKAITNCETKKLQEIIRPAGFFTQKSKRLKEICRFMQEFRGDFYKDATREQLLEINGIGRETADSILLYACDKKEFVVDAYTKRLLSRYGVLPKDAKYE